MGGDLAFDFCHARERLVPARLQFAGDQPVGRVSGVVLPEGAIRRICRFEIALEGFTYLIPPLVSFFLDSESGGNGAGPTTVRSASSIASSTRGPPKAMHRGSLLSIQPRLLSHQ